MPLIIILFLSLSIFFVVVSWFCIFIKRYFCNFFFFIYYLFFMQLADVVFLNVTVSNFQPTFFSKTRNSCENNECSLILLFLLTYCFWLGICYSDSKIILWVVDKVYISAASMNYSQFQNLNRNRFIFISSVAS